MIAVAADLDIGSTELADVNGLCGVASVGDDLYLEDNPLLANLAGLRALDIDGTFYVRNMPVAPPCQLERLAIDMTPADIDWDVARGTPPCEMSPPACGGF